MNIARTFRPVPVAALAFLAFGAVALAATIPNGTTFIAVTHKGINSATLTPGTDFKFHVDDPSQPALAGALVLGHVTDVTGPGGMSRASISFVFDYIQLSNGKKEPIHAAVVSKNVTQTNTAQPRKEQVEFLVAADAERHGHSRTDCMADAFPRQRHLAVDYAGTRRRHRRRRVRAAAQRTNRHPAGVARHPAVNGGSHHAVGDDTL